MRNPTLPDKAICKQIPEIAFNQFSTRSKEVLTPLRNENSQQIGVASAGFYDLLKDCGVDNCGL